MLKKPALLLSTALAVLLPASVMTTADGNPEEEYDFSGSADPITFLEQIESESYRCGLWTVQEVRHLKPFGDGWDIHDNAETHVNVFYGSRPVWRSGDWPSAGVGFPATDSGRLWEDELGAPTSNGTGDVTGSGGLTLLVRGHYGKGNGSLQILSLTTAGPVGSCVRVLWAGSSYDELSDLDGDRVFEIIARDLTHDYAGYMGPHSFWPRVVFCWSATNSAYTCAQAQFQRVPLRDSEEGLDNQANAALEDCRLKLEDTDEHPFDELSSTVIRLLYVGRAGDAVALVRASNLTSYEAYPNSDATRVSRERWWTDVVQGCRRSPFWTGLCDNYPDLTTLDLDLSKCR